MRNSKHRGVEDIQNRLLLSGLDACETKRQGIYIPEFGNLYKDIQSSERFSRVLVIESNSLQALALVTQLQIFNLECDLAIDGD